MDIENIRELTIREIVNNPEKYGVTIDEDEVSYVLPDEMVSKIAGQFSKETDLEWSDEGRIVCGIRYHDFSLTITRRGDGTNDVYLFIKCDFDYGRIDYDEGDHWNVAPSSEYISYGEVKDSFYTVELEDVMCDDTLGDIIDMLNEDIIDEIYEWYC